MTNRSKEDNARYQREWYSRNKDVQKARVKARNQRVVAENRARVEAMRLCCDHCGEDDMIVLDFHHEDPSQKDGNIAQMWKYSWSKLEAEIGTDHPGPDDDDVELLLD